MVRAELTPERAVLAPPLRAARERRLPGRQGRHVPRDLPRRATRSSASQAAQRADGTIVVAADSEAGVEHVRFVLGLDDDHSEFLRAFKDDPLLAETLKRVRGLRPVRTGTVAQSLLRAVAGQLIQASRARQIERSIIRACTPALGGLHAAPTCAELGRFSPAQLARHGLGARRALGADPPLPLARARAAEGPADRRRRAPARARARPRPVVGRRRLPRGARPLRARARARPRARQARLGALGPLGRGRGDRRAARALRRVGRPRERVPARRVPRGSRTLASCRLAA